MNDITVPVKVLSHAEDLPLPRYATEGAAAVDLFAAIDKPLILLPGTWDLIPTGLQVAVPEGYEIQIRPRSGLALKNGLTIPNSPGTIDSDYRGEVKVILANNGRKPVVIIRGDRIAQMALTNVVKIRWSECCRLPETNRGGGGFGHTGLR